MYCIKVIPFVRIDSCFQETPTIQTNPNSLKATATALILEPGEVPRSPSATAAPSSASLASLGIADQRVAVFQRSNGTLVSADKWPPLKNLASWLDKHPDCNVHASSASLAAVCYQFLIIFIYTTVDKLVILLHSICELSFYCF